MLKRKRVLFFTLNGEKENWSVGRERYFVFTRRRTRVCTVAGSSYSLIYENKREYSEESSDVDVPLFPKRTPWSGCPSFAAKCFVPTLSTPSDNFFLLHRKLFFFLQSSTREKIKRKTKKKERGWVIPSNTASPAQAHWKKNWKREQFVKKKINHQRWTKNCILFILSSDGPKGFSRSSHSVKYG